jgi:ABC-2 type transport system ATP-binding protein
VTTPGTPATPGAPNAPGTTATPATPAPFAPPARELLEFDRVTKWYGTVAALMDVSFRVGCEVVGLVGKNGVGKSTLMKLAVGLLRPSQGRVLVAGHAADTLTARALVGFCPEVERLYEELTGVTFVAWMLRYHGFSRREARERAAATLDQLGLGPNMHRRIREYSKGMRQRVRLAQALGHEPRFVLLDEPMTGLDPVARRDLAATIRALPARGVGVLVSSHVLHELEAVVDRVALVHQGRLLADGKVGELRAQLPAQPHRLRVATDRPRELAAALVAWPQVASVTLRDGALEVAVDGHEGFHAQLTDFAAAWPGAIHELVALDDDLASIFGYLVG